MNGRVYADYLVKGRAINGAWVEWNAMLCKGYETTLDCINIEIAVPLKSNMPSVELRAYTIETETICRFAYMQDSFGEKLYEGDIVLLDGYVFVIAFGICGGVKNVNHQVGYYGIYFEPANKETQKTADYGLRDDPLYFMAACKLCKRIGNIYDKYCKYEKDKGRSRAIKAALEHAERGF